MAASAADYIPAANIAQIQPKQQLTDVNFILTLGTTCEDDCTYAIDSTVRKECSGKNGCSFYDETAKNACNFAQPGWLRDYSPTQVVECAEGAPQPKIETKATVTCSGENMIKITKVVKFKGKLARLVVAACR